MSSRSRMPDGSVDEYDPLKARARAVLQWCLSVTAATDFEGVEHLVSIPKLKAEINQASMAVQLRTFNPRDEVFVSLLSGGWLLALCTREVLSENRSLFKETFDGASQSQTTLPSALLFFVLQGLAIRGIRPAQKGRTITPNSLAGKDNDFDLGGHVGVMEAILSAHTTDCVNVDNVLARLRMIDGTMVDDVKPRSTQDAISLWVNEICFKLDHYSKGERNRFTSRVDNLLHDNRSGSILASVVAYYAPSCINSEELVCGENVSDEDALKNHMAMLSAVSKLGIIFPFEAKDLLVGHEDLAGVFMDLTSLMFVHLETIPHRERSFDIGYQKRVSGNAESKGLSNPTARSTASQQSQSSHGSRVPDQEERQRRRAEKMEAIRKERQVIEKLERELEDLKQRRNRLWPNRVSGEAGNAAAEKVPAENVAAAAVTTSAAAFSAASSALRASRDSPDSPAKRSAHKSEALLHQSQAFIQRALGETTGSDQVLLGSMTGQDRMPTARRSDVHSTGSPSRRSYEHSQHDDNRIPIRFQSKTGSEITIKPTTPIAEGSQNTDGSRDSPARICSTNSGHLSSPLGDGDISSPTISLSPKHHEIRQSLRSEASRYREELNAMNDSIHSDRASTVSKSGKRAVENSAQLSSPSRRYDENEESARNSWSYQDVDLPEDSIDVRSSHRVDRQSGARPNDQNAGATAAIDASLRESTASSIVGVEDARAMLQRERARMRNNSSRQSDRSSSQQALTEQTNVVSCSQPTSPKARLFAAEALNASLSPSNARASEQHADIDEDSNIPEVQYRFAEGRQSYAGDALSRQNPADEDIDPYKNYNARHKVESATFHTRKGVGAGREGKQSDFRHRAADVHASQALFREKRDRSEDDDWFYGDDQHRRHHGDVNKSMAHLPRQHGNRTPPSSEKRGNRKTWETYGSHGGDGKLRGAIKEAEEDWFYGKEVSARRGDKEFYRSMAEGLKGANAKNVSGEIDDEDAYSDGGKRTYRRRDNDDFDFYGAKSVRKEGRKSIADATRIRDANARTSSGRNADVYMSTTGKAISRGREGGVRPVDGVEIDENVDGDASSGDDLMASRMVHADNDYYGDLSDHEDEGDSDDAEDAVQASMRATRSSQVRESASSVATATSSGRRSDYKETTPLRASNESVSRSNADQYQGDGPMNESVRSSRTHGVRASVQSTRSSRQSIGNQEEQHLEETRPSQESSRNEARVEADAVSIRESQKSVPSRYRDELYSEVRSSAASHQSSRSGRASSPDRVRSSVQSQAKSPSRSSDMPRSSQLFERDDSERADADDVDSWGDDVDQNMDLYDNDMHHYKGADDEDPKVYEEEHDEHEEAPYDPFSVVSYHVSEPSYSELGRSDIANPTMDSSVKASPPAISIDEEAPRFHDHTLEVIRRGIGTPPRQDDRDAIRRSHYRDDPQRYEHLENPKSSSKMRESAPSWAPTAYQNAPRASEKTYERKIKMIRETTSPPDSPPQEDKIKREKALAFMDIMDQQKRMESEKLAAQRRIERERQRIGQEVLKELVRIGKEPDLSRAAKNNPQQTALTSPPKHSAQHHDVVQRDPEVRASVEHDEIRTSHQEVRVSRQNFMERPSTGPKDPTLGVGGQEEDRPVTADWGARASVTTSRSIAKGKGVVRESKLRQNIRDFLAQSDDGGDSENGEEDEEEPHELAADSPLIDQPSERESYGGLSAREEHAQGRVDGRKARKAWDNDGSGTPLNKPSVKDLWRTANPDGGQDDFWNENPHKSFWEAPADNPSRASGERWSPHQSSRVPNEQGQDDNEQAADAVHEESEGGFEGSGGIITKTAAYRILLESSETDRGNGEAAGHYEEDLSHQNAMLEAPLSQLHGEPNPNDAVEPRPKSRGGDVITIDFNDTRDRERIEQKRSRFLQQQQKKMEEMRIRKERERELRDRGGDEAQTPGSSASAQVYTPRNNGPRVKAPTSAEQTPSSSRTPQVMSPSYAEARSPARQGRVVEPQFGARRREPSAGAARRNKALIRSNRKIVRNAINHVCLAGYAKEKEKVECLELYDAWKGENFIVLFQDDKIRTFRGLYGLDPESEKVVKIFGAGPAALEEKMIERYFKYDSGAKDFKPLTSNGFNVAVDAVALLPQFSKRKPKKPVYH